jgi:hypothetical protein
MTDYVRLTQSFPVNHKKAQNFLAKLAKDFFRRPAATLVHQAGFTAILSFFVLTDRFEQRAIPVHSPPPRA